ncbi:MAG: flagellar motor switch phosphatase FliY [Clostridiales bacterium]|nr:flagellar motor switch phosphatase FliY [Clostridiales bacterium]
MNTEQKFMTPEELDTIGEIMNISMGAAATAVSTMLERQVVITTPQISQNMLKNIDMSELEPAIAVRIKYVEGISGNNMIMLRRDDMRIILDLLMGNEDLGGDEPFEFDEMSMSAASEVMNQMMGASATALSELLNRSINISTPEAILVENTAEAYSSFPEVESNENVLAISFKMTIKETLDTTFTSLMPIDLTKDIVKAMNGEVEQEDIQPEAEPQMETPMPQTPPPAAPQPEPFPQQQAPAMQMPQQPPASPAQQQYMQQPPMQGGQYQQPYQPPLEPASPQNQYPQQMPPYPPQYMPPYTGTPYPQYGMYQDPQQPVRYPAPMVSVKQADFPEFTSKAAPQTAYGSNMDMLMGVSLDVSVVVGRAKEKIKNVLEFGQGTVIELDKQTGAPAEVIVNGKLLAYGDVVVVGDNFGIRITEIVGTKELLDSLEPKK